MNQQPLYLDKLTTDLLEPVSLQVKPGEIACLSGPSGSGKSRLLRAIADLDPHEGSVRLGDYTQAKVPAHHWRRMVMLVPAESAWWFDTVGEHMYTPQSATLQELGLEPEVMEWPVDRLSSGEKQRLALVRAVSCEPAALLLDEPTANLDPDTTRLVEHWLTGYIREREIPAFWVAHDSEQIERVGDQHLHIAGGRLEGH
ncbi:ABC transporter ATP-binding protein [Microbulbifer yueqingensis]|uniref:ABC transporter n=1 Tax=Microbulbifer yueqingensis TaxID=658219 RepID=A0A1G8Y550_9GAMM|nr:ATP-binding cassette domain-containing protein [Microbulbifer yueqingensis]SDJ97926.1 ABC transporter [Microbulbifer yueqingensis]